MAKKSDKDIQNMSVDWACDSTSGNIPFSGASVQRFIKKSLESKYARCYFDPESLTLYFFKDDETYDEFCDDPTKIELPVDSVRLEFSTTQYRIRTTPDRSTTVNVSTNSDDILLGMSVRVEKRELGEPWEATGQDIEARVFVDVLNTGNYVEKEELRTVILSTSGRLELNMKQYLPVGSSRVRIQFEAEDDEGSTISSSIVWNVNVAEMYIEEWNNTWYRALVENNKGADYHLGGFRIIGAVPKILHIEISTAYSVVAYYERDISISQTLASEYLFTQNEGLNLAAPKSREGTPLNPLTTGVYNVKVWLTSGEMSTYDNAIVYSIMYVAPGDENSTQLVVMNNCAGMVNNYDSAAHLCDYSVYDKGALNANIEINTTIYIGATPYKQDLPVHITVPTGSKRELSYNINVVTGQKNLHITYSVSVLPSEYEQSASSPINNEEIFQAADGASFFLNTSLRDNGESDREVVYNTVDNAVTPVSGVTWQGMSWVDGMDGWTKDDGGRRSCLRIPARTRLIIPDSGYSFLSSQTGSFAVELCFKVSNVSDYSENIITIGQNFDSNSFLGIRIKPTNITVHSNAETNAVDDIYNGTNFKDDEVIHLLLSFQRSYGDKAGKNLVSGFINGTMAFQREFGNNAIWSTNSSFATFGSDTADLFLYTIRAYKRPLSSLDAENNWINTLMDRDDKVAARDLRDSIFKKDTRKIDYERLKDDGVYNFFVIEMIPSTLPVPDLDNQISGRANIEMHYGKDREGNSRSNWDWKIYDIKISGQGTTSMNYYKWNLRWRIDEKEYNKERNVAYYGAPTMDQGHKVYNELSSNVSKTVWFDGQGNHPAVNRITAKINFASSMQSHKMGATGAYNVLHDNLLDGAMLNWSQRNCGSGPMPSVAVYQYPAFGFQKVPNPSAQGEYNYEFIGLFTIGPDKGDMPTFGYDIVPKANLISLEGSDHDPQAVNFSVPWDEQMVYFVDDGDGYLGTRTGVVTNEKAIEVGKVGSADADDASAAMSVLEQSFKPAYSVIYDNSTLIFPVALDDSVWGDTNPEPSERTASTVLSNINDNPLEFRGTIYRKNNANTKFHYKDMEFWIEGEYVLYHYDAQEKQFVSGYKSNGAYSSPLNLLEDTGVTATQLAECATLEEQNELFRQARRNRFLSNVGTYWNVDELVFNYVYMIIFGATDNFAKNQYPYFMGEKWGFRQDDLDTILDVDNNGAQTKPYYIEFEDHKGSSPYFGGGNSVLWNLVHESMMYNYSSGGSTHQGILSLGKLTIEKMTELAAGRNYYEGFVKFFEEYFWKNAQEYFPCSAYNIDASFKYENAWLTDRNGYPLHQSLGSHHLAELLWAHRRAVYCMSMFNVGPFINNMDISLGQIYFRPTGGSMDVSVAQAMYPRIISGDGNLLDTKRAFEGDDVVFVGFPTSGETRCYVQAINYLTDLGDLKDLKLGNQDNGVFPVSGKRMRYFKLGDQFEEVTTNITSLNLDDTNGLPCLEIIDLRNVENLQGDLGLESCPRIKEVYADNTSLSSVSLPRGSKIEVLHLPDSITTISYQIVRYLRDLELPADPSNIITLYLEECNALNSIETLETIFNTPSNSLAYIRLVWQSEINVTGSQIHVLAEIKRAGSAYSGVDDSGSPVSGVNPIVAGRMITQSYYPSDIETLAGGEADDSTDHPGMKVIQAPYFGGETFITYPTDGAYLEFVDSNVEAVLADEFGDGVGIKVVDAEAIQTFGTIFNNNTDITSFDELDQFTGLSSIGGAFYGCSKLESIVIPSHLAAIDYNAFRDCVSLEEVIIPSSVRSIGNYVFSGCTSLSTPTIQSGVNSIGVYAFSGCSSFSGKLVLPSSLISIGESAFLNCSGLSEIEIYGEVNMPIRPFNGCSFVSKITVHGNTVFTYGDTSYTFFTGLTGLRSLYVDNIGKYISLCSCSNLYIANTPFGDSGPGGTIYVNNVALSGNVEIPSGLTIIGGGAFKKVLGITSIDFADTVTEFAPQCCNNTTIVHVIVRSTVPPQVSSSSFTASVKIYVPYGYSSAYTSDSDWVTYSSQIYELASDGTIPE